MTPTVQPYLFLNGRCDEALAFYRDALGARIAMAMRFRDAPDPPPPGTLPAGWEDKVMHAELRIGEAVVMLSDGMSATPRFDGFALAIAFPTAAEVDRCFAALAEGGVVTMPLGATFWSQRFGMVTDRFGVGWMVSVASPAA